MSMGNVNEGRNELGQFVQGRQETAEEKIKRIKASIVPNNFLIG